MDAQDDGKQATKVSHCFARRGAQCLLHGIGTSESSARNSDLQTRIYSIAASLEKAGYKLADVDELEHLYVERLVARLEGLETFANEIKSAYGVTDRQLDKAMFMALLDEIHDTIGALGDLRLSMALLLTDDGASLTDECIVEKVRQLVDGPPPKKRWFFKRSAA